MPISMLLLKVGAADDLARCITWYRDHLGFEVRDHEVDRFAILGPGDDPDGPELALHVGDPLADAERVSIYVEVADVEEVAAGLAAAGWPIATRPVDKPWGGRVAATPDPVGHIVKPYHPIERTEARRPGAS